MPEVVHGNWVHIRKVDVMCLGIDVVIDGSAGGSVATGLEDACKKEHFLSVAE